MFQMTADLIPAFSGRDKTQSVTRWVKEVDHHAEIFGWTPLQQLLVARRALTGTAALWVNTERLHRTWADLKAALINEFEDSINSTKAYEIMSAANLLQNRKDNERSGNPKTIRCYFCGEMNHSSADCPYKEKCTKCFKYNEFGHMSTKCTSTQAQMQAETSGCCMNGTNAATRRMADAELQQNSNDPKFVSNITSKAANDCAHAYDGDLKMAESAKCAETAMSKIDTDSYKKINNIEIGKERSANEYSFEKPTISVVICEKTANALIDTGSDETLMTADDTSSSANDVVLVAQRLWRAFQQQREERQEKSDDITRIHHQTRTIIDLDDAKDGWFANDMQYKKKVKMKTC